MDIRCYFREGAQVTQETQGAFFPSSNQASSKMLPLLQACPVTLAVFSELIPASTGGWESRGRDVGQCQASPECVTASLGLNTLRYLFLPSCHLEVRGP